MDLILRELCDRIAQFPRLYKEATMNSVMTIGPGAVAGRTLMRAGDYMATKLEDAAVEIQLARFFNSSRPYNEMLELQKLGDNEGRMRRKVFRRILANLANGEINVIVEGLGKCQWPENQLYIFLLLLAYCKMSDPGWTWLPCTKFDPVEPPFVVVPGGRRKWTPVEPARVTQNFAVLLEAIAKEEMLPETLITRIFGFSYASQPFADLFDSSTPDPVRFPRKESSRLQTLVLGSYSLPPDERPSFEPAFTDIRLVRRMLQSRRLSKSVANRILRFAEYFAIIYGEKTNHPWEQFETRPSTVEFGSYHVKEPCVSTRVLTDEEAKSIVRVTAVVEGCDQGWSAEAEEKGRPTSHTWYTVGILNRTPNDEPIDVLPGSNVFLADNLHAISVPQMHAAAWDADTPFVSALRKQSSLGYRVCIWAEGRYGAWINNVQYGKISLYCLPEDN